FQCSTSGPSAVFDPQLPTAVTSELENARMPVRKPPLAPAGSGAVTFDHDDPFQARIRGRPEFPTPTAQACDGELAAMPFSWRPGADAVENACHAGPVGQLIQLCVW